MSKAIKRNGSWHIVVYDYTDANGKQHNRSFTAPTKADAERKAAEFKSDKKRRTRKPSDDMTVREAVERYIELKALLSPTTTDSYSAIMRFAFPDLMDRKVSKLDEMDMQIAVNNEAHRIGQKGRPISAKTLKNEWSLLHSALKTVCHRDFGGITLTQVQRHIKVLPEAEDVIRAVVGTDIELPCMLALWLSFSMSEIRGLMFSDIKDGYIIVDRVRVETRKGSVVKENAKVDTRLRMHKLPPYIMQLINDTEGYRKWLKSAENGFLVPFNRKTIYEKWQRICEENDLGKLSFHDLRHINCSVMTKLNINEQVIKERGGWKTSFVPKSVYTHSFSSDREEADALVDAFFERNLV